MGAFDADKLFHSPRTEMLPVKLMLFILIRMHGRSIQQKTLEF